MDKLTNAALACKQPVEYVLAPSRPPLVGHALTELRATGQGSHWGCVPEAV
jgi:hypothetical protein